MAKKENVLNKNLMNTPLRFGDFIKNLICVLGVLSDRASVSLKDGIPDEKIAEQVHHQLDSLYGLVTFMGDDIGLSKEEILALWKAVLLMANEVVLTKHILSTEQKSKYIN